MGAATVRKSWTLRIAPVGQVGYPGAAQVFQIRREWFDSDGSSNLEEIGRSAFSWLEHGFTFDAVQPAAAQPTP